MHVVAEMCGIIPDSLFLAPFWITFLNELVYIRNQLCHFYFCLPSQRGTTLKEKNLLLRKQILFFKSSTPFWKSNLSRKQRESHISCFLS